MRFPPESVARIVDTSSGPVRLEFHQLGRLLGGVTVSAFDDNGWEVEGGWWGMRRAEEPLAALVKTVGRLPENEASEIAGRFLQEAQQRYAIEARKRKYALPMAEFVGFLVGTFLPSALAGAAVALVVSIVL